MNSRMASFYERAGIVECDGKPKRLGSVSVIGAISPPGGDFSEPVTQSTMQIVKAVWALDAQLAYARHYPAINWLESYSAYAITLESWWNENVSGNWFRQRQRALSLLQQEEELKRLIQVVGVGALSEEEKMRLEAAKMLREFFLRQNVFDPVDYKCSPDKQYKMLELLLLFIEEGLSAIQNWGATAEKIRSLPAYEKLASMNRTPEEEFEQQSIDWQAQIVAEMQGLKS